MVADAVTHSKSDVRESNLKINAGTQSRTQTHNYAEAQANLVRHFMIHLWWLPFMHERTHGSVNARAAKWDGASLLQNCSCLVLNDACDACQLQSTWAAMYMQVAAVMKLSIHLILPVAWNRFLQIVFPVLGCLLHLLVVFIIHVDDVVKLLEVLWLQWSGIWIRIQIALFQGINHSFIHGSVFVLFPVVLAV